MKYVYVVTRIIQGGSEGTTHIPNLGVHTNLKSAERHFKSVMTDRKKHNNVNLTMRYSPSGYDFDKCHVLKEMAMRYDELGNEIFERVRLERWKTK